MSLVVKESAIFRERLIVAAVLFGGATEIVRFVFDTALARRIVAA